MAFESADLANVYYTVLLKDIGCTANAARLFEIYGADDLQIKSDFRRADAQDMVQLLRYVAGHVTPFSPLRRRLARLIRIIRNGKHLQRELIVASFPTLDALVPLVAMHHEHLDGTGFPHRRATDVIPLVPESSQLPRRLVIFAAVIRKQRFHKSSRY